jgi:hypothetical protein
MTQSTEAMMDSGEQLSYLTTTKISDGSWRGTTKIFILNWIDKLGLYHELIPVADRLSENTQRTLLQNAVIGLNALHQFRFTAGYAWNCFDVRSIPHTIYQLGYWLQ